MIASLRGPLVEPALRPGENAFGLLRLALAAAVVWSHVYSIGTGSGANEPLKLSTGYSLGEHAVNGFFVISGLLVAMSFDKRGLKQYLAARFLRLFPGLAGATLFSALLLGPIYTTLSTAGYFSHGQTWYFIWQVLTDLKSANRLPGVFEANPMPFIMATVWTLKYEVFCYIGLAVLASLGFLRERQRAAIFLATLTVAMFVYFFLNPMPDTKPHIALRLVFLFAAGATVYAYRDRVRLSWALLAVLVVVCILLRNTSIFMPAMLVTEAYGALVVALGPLARFAWEPKDDLSYGIYLFGFPIQQAIQASAPDIGIPAFLALSFVLTLPVAFASWRLIEKPMLTFKTRAAPLNLSLRSTP